jgi:hypothetical protein
VVINLVSPTTSIKSELTTIANDPICQNDLIDEQTETTCSSMTVDSNNEESKFLARLVSIEPEYVQRLQHDLEQSGLIKRMIAYSSLRQTSHGQGQTVASDELRHLILNLINIECKALIAWAKHLPDSVHMCIQDKTCSYELKFLEVIILKFIWRSIELGDESIFLHERLSLTSHCFNQLNMSDIYGHLSSLVRKLRLVGFTQSEFLCLKVLTVFKSDFDLMNVGKLDTFRQKCLATLRVQTVDGAAGSLTSSSSVYRYDSLLILLSDIKSISIRFVFALFMFYKEQNVPVPLHDMLSQSQNLFGLMALRGEVLISGDSADSSCGNKNFEMIEEKFENDEGTNTLISP